jgi:hypothetical protein
VGRFLHDETGFWSKRRKSDDSGDLKFAVEIYLGIKLPSGEVFENMVLNVSRGTYTLNPS